MPGGDLAVLNVYASTIERERVELWSELLASLPKDCNWILSGDWNFVETRADKSNNCGRMVSQAERRTFEQLLGALNVGDHFPRTNPIKYSWDNRRRDGVRVLARLDRIYSTNPAGGQTSTVAEYFIRGDSAHSDHLPVWGKFLLQAAP